MSEIRVKIPEEISNKVEQKFFEYNASQNIIGYLMSREDVREESLNKYISIAENRFVELELLKGAVVSEYFPDSAYTGYMFDFHDNSIVFTTK